VITCERQYYGLIIVDEHPSPLQPAMRVSRVGKESIDPKNPVELQVKRNAGRSRMLYCSGAGNLS
jgi:hypothetical protein